MILAFVRASVMLGSSNVLYTLWPTTKVTRFMTMRNVGPIIGASRKPKTVPKIVMEM
jgi:hypothetical protein